MIFYLKNKSQSKNGHPSFAITSNHSAKYSLTTKSDSLTLKPNSETPVNEIASLQKSFQFHEKKYMISAFSLFCWLVVAACRGGILDCQINLKGLKKVYCL